MNDICIRSLGVYGFFLYIGLYWTPRRHFHPKMYLTHSAILGLNVALHHRMYLTHNAILGLHVVTYDSHIIDHLALMLRQLGLHLFLLLVLLQLDFAHPATFDPLILGLLEIRLDSSILLLLGGILLWSGGSGETNKAAIFQWDFYVAVDLFGYHLVEDTVVEW